MLTDHIIKYFWRMRKFAEQACHFEKRSDEKSLVDYKKRLFGRQGSTFEFRQVLFTYQCSGYRLVLGISGKVPLPIGRNDRF